MCHNRAFGIFYMHWRICISLACVRNNWTGANHHSQPHRNISCIFVLKKKIVKKKTVSLIVKAVLFYVEGKRNGKSSEIIRSFS